MSIKMKVFVTSFLLFSLFVFCHQRVFAAPDWNNIYRRALDTLIQDKMNDAHIPGLSVGIIKNNQVVYLKGFGKAGPSGQAVTAQTPFVVGSVSKTFTAMAIMQLVESGKVKLDMPVQQYIPWFELADADESSKITVRELLNHTSGISTYSNEAIHAKTLEQFVHNLRNIRLTKSVGSSFQYSNTNFYILGQLIQSVTGLSFEEYIKRNIFTPLDMKHSYVSKNDAQEDGLATGYRLLFGFPFPIEPLYQVYDLPAGSIISCAEDMMHYASALLNGGKYKDKTVIPFGSILQMYTPSSIVSSTERYGLGWHMDIGGNMFYHGGSTVNFQSNITVIPKNDYALVVLYNTSFMPITTLFKGKTEAISYFITSISVGVAPPAKLSIKNAYFILNSILLFLTLILVLYLFKLRRWNSVLKKKNKIILRSIFTLLFNFILPVIITVLIPAVFNTTWHEALSNAPDIAYFIIGYSTILFFTGMIKCFWIVNYFKNNSIEQYNNRKSPI